MLSTIRDVTHLLGIEPRKGEVMSQIRLIDRVKEGLPLSVLERVSTTVAPDDKSFKYRIVPKATLARRKRPRANKLLSIEGDKTVRLAQVWAIATDAWGGEASARDFLFRSHPLLEGPTPIDLVLDSELGADMVNNILGRLKYGTAA